MASTPENLKEAFAGESQANRKYLAFAKKADQDGFPNIARLFRTTAEAETIHAHGHLEAMGGIGSTADVLAVRRLGCAGAILVPRFLVPQPGTSTISESAAVAIARAAGRIRNDGLDVMRSSSCGTVSSSPTRGSRGGSRARWMHPTARGW